ncbi:unnamed protein product [Spirodela intermedia]|uniref:Uncharacterized protein n=1 Tax=Spirodela intermedia TaxID=51605 RepID=A0A7I8KHH0_SPIIN|nr:unnamed protein product [Spirodela intermedia]
MGAKNRSSYASPCSQLRAEYHDCFNRFSSLSLSLPLSPCRKKVRERERYPSLRGARFRPLFVADGSKLGGDRRWYSEKFSKGQWDKEECVAEWEKYRACLAQHLEDRHLRRLLAEADPAAFPKEEDPAHSADGSSGR